MALQNSRGAWDPDTLKYMDKIATFWRLAINVECGISYGGVCGPTARRGDGEGVTGTRGSKREREHRRGGGGDGRATTARDCVW